MADLTRANKVAVLIREGQVVATFWKTHNRIKTVTQAEMVAEGFKPTPEAEGKEIKPNELTTQAKAWIIVNAAKFGVMYDPNDRRTEKFPAKYNTDKELLDTAETVMVQKLEEVVGSAHQIFIQKLIAEGKLPKSAEIDVNYGTGEISAVEKYSGGNMKYATVSFPLTCACNGKSSDGLVCKIALISGQIKKPTDLTIPAADGKPEEKIAFTATSLKNWLVTKDVIPAPAPKEQPKKKSATEKKVSDTEEQTAVPTME